MVMNYENYLNYNNISEILMHKEYSSAESKKIGNYIITIPKTTNIDYNIFRGDLFMNKSNSNKKEFIKLENKETGKYIILNKSITFYIEINKDGFYYSNDQYNIYAFGKCQSEVENNLLEEFLIQYESYAFTSDDKLDSKALLLKKNLLSIYGENSA